MQRPPVEVELTSPVAQVLQKGYIIVTGSSPEIVGVSGYTDAALASLVTGNQQCVVFGPGDFEIAHTVNEYVTVEDLIVCENVLTEAIKIALG